MKNKIWTFIEAFMQKWYASKPATLDDVATSGGQIYTPQTPDLPSAAKKLYGIAKASLGQHLTLNPLVPEEEGCCEAVSYLLKQCGYPIPPKGVPNVVGLTNWMLLNHFKEVPVPQPGAIITAHNVNELIITGAHVGVCLIHGIGSNTSANGLFQENYSYVGWLRYFGGLSSKTRYFLPN